MNTQRSHFPDCDDVKVAAINQDPRTINNISVIRTRAGRLPGVVEVLFVLVPVEDGETQHPAGDDLRLLQELV